MIYEIAYLWGYIGALGDDHLERVEPKLREIEEIISAGESELRRAQEIVDELNAQIAELQAQLAQSMQHARLGGESLNQPAEVLNQPADKDLPSPDKDPVDQTLNFIDATEDEVPAQPNGYVDGTAEQHKYEFGGPSYTYTPGD